LSLGRIKKLDFRGLYKNIEYYIFLYALRGVSIKYVFNISGVNPHQIVFFETPVAKFLFEFALFKYIYTQPLIILKQNCKIFYYIRNKKALYTYNNLDTL